MEKFRQNLIISVAAAKEKIEKIRKEDSVVFPLFADLHSSGKGCERLDMLCEALKLITEQIKCDMVANLGDNVAMLGRNLHISNDELCKTMGDMLDEIYVSVNCPLICVNGNHDAIGTDFFKPDFWNGIVKNKYGNTNAVYGNDGSYYYLDFEKANTRFVVLSVPYESELYAVNPTPLWAFGEKQLEWLEKEALNVTGNVIILVHVPFYYSDRGDKTTMLEVWNGESASMAYITDLCGRIEDVKAATEIIGKFSARSDTNLVACFSGHTHIDELWQGCSEFVLEGEESYFNPLPCYQIVTCGTCAPKATHEIFGIAIDIVLWTPSENRLCIIRVGDGEDRTVAVPRFNGQS